MNGWTNRETWLVVLHFSDLVSNGWSWDGVKAMIEEEWDAISKTAFFSDYLNLGLINWDEIKRSGYGDDEE
tara:strand:- start:1471 stop:1683 length:213 start_codon:yes stop_codon:yes gene_type:complete